MITLDEILSLGFRQRINGVTKKISYWEKIDNNITWILSPLDKKLFKIKEDWINGRFCLNYFDDLKGYPQMATRKFIGKLENKKQLEKLI